MHYNIRLNGTEYVTLTEPAPTESDVANVDWNTTVSGKEVPLLWGSILRKRGYRLYLDSTDEVLWDAFIASLNNYSETFILDDHNADLITVRFLTPPAKSLYKLGNKYVDIEMIEVLGVVSETTTTT